MSGRRLVNLLAAAGFACGFAASATAAELVVVSTGGIVEKALRQNFYDPFEKQTGIKVISVSAASGAEAAAKLKAMAEAGRVEWDLIVLADDAVIRNRAYLDKIDCSRIPNATKLAVEGSCNSDRGLVRDYFANVIAYNSEKIKREPQGWRDFFDVEKFPGRRGLPASSFVATEVLASALLADGVEPGKLLPLDLDRAFRKLDRLKPHVAVWWKTGDQSQQIFRAGEVDIAHVWSGRPLSLAATSDLPIKVSWKQGFNAISWWVPISKAPNKDSTYKFLNFFLENPKAHVEYAKMTFYDTPSKEALNALPQEERRRHQTHPENWRSLILLDPVAVQSQQAEIARRWNEWISK